MRNGGMTSTTYWLKDAMTAFYIILGLTLIVPYLLYVGIITKRNKALEALASIDVQLKQRLDLIPNVLKIAGRFMEHEKSLLTEVTELRTRVSQSYDRTNSQAVSEHLGLIDQLSSKMGQLMVSVEAYPDLKSNQPMMQAMQTYNEVESHIAASRRFFNSAVNDLNNAVQIFPGNVVARWARVEPMPFFKAESVAESPIDADQYLR
jgi:LemA protein